MSVALGFGRGMDPRVWKREEPWWARLFRCVRAIWRELTR